MSHPREHEDLLRDLALGEREQTDPEVERTLAGCPECAERLADLEHTRARLDQAAAAQAAELAEAAEIELEPRRERIERELRRLAEEPGQRPHHLRIWGNLLAVAAVALVVVGIFVWPRPDPPGPPVYLSEDGIALVEPKGPVEGEAFTRFAWEYDGPPGTFTLRIYELADEGPGRLIVEESFLEQSSWPPTDHEHELPARIFWRVEVDEDGAPGASASASAWLSQD